MGWAFDGRFVAFSRHRRRRFDFADIWALMERCVVFRVDSAYDIVIIGSLRLHTEARCNKHPNVTRKPQGRLFLGRSQGTSVPCPQGALVEKCPGGGFL